MHWHWHWHWEVEEGRLSLSANKRLYSLPCYSSFSAAEEEEEGEEAERAGRFEEKGHMQQTTN